MHNISKCQWLRHSQTLINILFNNAQCTAHFMFQWALNKTQSALKLRPVLILWMALCHFGPHLLFSLSSHSPSSSPIGDRDDRSGSWGVRGRWGGDRCHPATSRAVWTGQRGDHSTPTSRTSYCHGNCHQPGHSTSELRIFTHTKWVPILWSQLQPVGSRLPQTEPYAFDPTYMIQISI